MVLHSGEQITLSEKHTQFLWCLLRRPNDVINYREIAREAWGVREDIDDLQLQHQKHTIHSTKTSLVTLLRQHGIEPDFIKGLPRIGYRISVDIKVTEPAVAARKQNTEARPTAANSPSSDQDDLLHKDTAFIAAISLAYALLFGVAFLLEIAYQFESLGTTGLVIAIGTVLLIGPSLFLSLKTASFRLDQGRRTLVLVLLAGFFTPAIVVYLAAAQFLPTYSVTEFAHETTFQSQPAIAAYFKNVFLYIVPPGVLFILGPLYVVWRTRYEIRESRDPRLWERATTWTAFGLIFFWITTLLYSVLATFELSDRLQAGPFHSLFLVLLFSRFVLMFGLSLACLVWLGWNLLKIRRLIYATAT